MDQRGPQNSFSLFSNGSISNHVFPLISQIRKTDKMKLSLLASLVAGASAFAPAVYKSGVS